MSLILPSQAPPPDARIRIAFGADLTAAPGSWPWVDVTDRLPAQEIQITRGRSDEGTETQPASTSFVLDNLDGALTPDNPTSPWWPNVRPNTPCDISVRGARHLLLDGTSAGNASTPVHPSLQITGNIDLRFEGDLAQWDVSQIWAHEVPTLVGRWKAASNQRSYLFFVFEGLLTFAWTTDGVHGTSVAADFGRPLPVTTGHLAARIALRVNNGAGGHDVMSWWGPSIEGPWEHIATVTLPGTTSIFAGTAPAEVGVITEEEVTAPFAGRGYRAQIRSGIEGLEPSTIVANPDFRAQAPGTTSFTDSVGRVWTVNGTAQISDWHPRFSGQIGELAPTWPYGDLSDPDHPDERPGESRVTVTAGGILRRLSQGQKPLRSTLYRFIAAPSRADVVIAYWPLEDAREATSGASPIAGVEPLTVGGDWQWASDDTLAASEALPSVSGGQPAGWNAVVPAPAGSPTQWRVDLFVNMASGVAGPPNTPLMVVETNGTVRTWEISANAGQIALAGRDADGQVVILVDGGSPTGLFGQWNRISLAAEQNGGSIDWEVAWIPLGEDLFNGFSGSEPGTVGRVTRVANLFTAPPDGISFGHLTVTTGQTAGWLSSADLGNGLTGGPDTAFVGETAAARFRRLCIEEGIDQGIIGVLGDPGTPMGPQRPAPLLELLQECADAEVGILAEMVAQPGLVFRTRASLYNQPPALQLDAATSDIANPFEPRFDDQRLRNDVTVQREGGSSARVTTDPPPAPGDLYDDEVTVNVASDEQLPDQAGWRLHLGTWPGMRYPSLTTDLMVAPHLADAWQAVRQGDRITVDNLPPQHPPGPVDELVEGWTETISRPTVHRIEANCSPAGPWTVGVLDDDTPTTTLARLDTDNSELQFAIDDTDNVISVEVIAGPGWVTTALQPAAFPFDVLVGGERMTVTAIVDTGGGGYDFTVQRSSNGVVKAHPAGTPVQVADPFRLAL